MVISAAVLCLTAVQALGYKVPLAGGVQAPAVAALSACTLWLVVVITWLSASPYRTARRARRIAWLVTESAVTSLALATVGWVISSWIRLQLFAITHLICLPAHAQPPLDSPSVWAPCWLTSHGKGRDGALRDVWVSVNRLKFPAGPAAGPLSCPSHPFPSDATYFERLHGEALIDLSPEEIAEGIRARF